MNTRPLPPDYRAVIRYTYALGTIFAVSAFVIIGAVLLRVRYDTESRTRMERHHVTTIMLSDELDGYLHRLRSTLHEVEPSAPSGSPSYLEYDAATHLRAIEQCLDAIVERQQDQGKTLTAGTVQRMQSQYARLLDRLEQGRGPPVAAMLDAVEVAVHQLHQLHSVGMEQELEGMSEHSAVQTRQFIGTVLLLLLLTIVLAVRLFRLIQVRLDRHLVAEQALLDQERQLQQAGKMQALGTLVGGVAHDFNNILTVILGNAQLLQGALAEDNPDGQFVEEIDEAASRAADLTRQLLAFSRYEIVDRGLLDLNLAIRNMQGLLRRLIREDIVTDFELRPDVGSVRLDLVQLEQILINLATNASDAMPDGGSLVIRTDPVAWDAGEKPGIPLPPGRYARLHVHDSGTGMSPEVANRIFDPFFTTKEPDEGTGLGLSTVHGIVTGCGGHITVESEPGRGTRMEIYLPREEPGEDEYAPEAAGEQECLTGKESILLVEDDAQIRTFAGTILRRNGYSVRDCGNGVEALCLFQEQPAAFDLILTDVVLPGLRGPDLVAHARETRPDMPVVYMSGYSEPDLLRTVHASGDPLLPKPFHAKELLRVLRQRVHRLEKSDLPQDAG